MSEHENEKTATAILENQGENMTIEIPKEKWTEFLNDFSKRRFGWNTKVEVIAESVGAQILSEGLILNGITHENKSGTSVIEISLGENTEHHQAHTISKPIKIAYRNENDAQAGVLEIEEGDATKTLISLMNPMPVYVGYVSYAMVSTA